MRDGVAAAALAVAVAAACGARAASSERAPGLRPVAIQGFAYRPKEVAVTLGDTVAWTNGDVVPHSVTADGTGSAARAFDSPDLAPKERFVWVAAKTGTYAYHCEMHPAMSGTVVVK